MALEIDHDAATAPEETEGWFARNRSAIVRHTVINLFNLIPISPLDGGHITAALFSKVTPMSNVDRVAFGALSIGLAITLFAFWQVAAHGVGPLPAR